MKWGYHHLRKHPYSVKSGLTCLKKKKKPYLDVPGRNLGSVIRINGLFHLFINGVYWGEINPLIPTFY